MALDCDKTRKLNENTLSAIHRIRRNLESALEDCEAIDSDTGEYTESEMAYQLENIIDGAKAALKHAQRLEPKDCFVK